MLNTLAWMLMFTCPAAGGRPLRDIHSGSAGTDLSITPFPSILPPDNARHRAGENDR